MRRPKPIRSGEPRKKTDKISQGCECMGEGGGVKKWGSTPRGQYLSSATCKKVKVKCTLVEGLRLCNVRTAYRGSRDIALPFLDHGTRREWGVSVTTRPLFTLGKDPVPFVQEAGWAPGPVWTGAENLSPTGIRSPDRPARSQSLYRLRYSVQN